MLVHVCVCVRVCVYYPTPPYVQIAAQVHFFKRSLTGLKTPV